LHSLDDLKRAAERLVAARPLATEARAFIEACKAKAADGSKDTWDQAAAIAGRSRRQCD
jgi:hypothetical protein